jgi:hypothetical protein
VTNNAASVTTTTVAARNARYVRLTITQSEQGSGERSGDERSARGSGAARIYELEVYNGSSAPAVAAPAILYSGQNATGRTQRFQAGAYDLTRGNLGIIGNDATRSMDVAPGYTATICRDIGLTPCTTLPAGRYATMPGGWDLAVSSLRINPVGS